MNKQINNMIKNFGEKGEDHLLLVTMVCPARFHSGSKQYGNFSPRQSNQYLLNAWRATRRILSNKGINLKGLRVVEAHKDGCPHFHIALSIGSNNTEQLKTAFNEQAVKTGVKIDFQSMQKGGRSKDYLLKYLLNPNERLKTWAGVWGIRRFQVIGS